MMKFCYIDITAAPTSTLSSAVPDMLAALERDFPDVTFVYPTTPLTTDPGFKSRSQVDARGRGTPTPPTTQHGERLPPWSAMPTARTVSSTSPCSSRRPRTAARSPGPYDGQEYHTLYEAYAIDEVP